MKNISATSAALAAIFATNAIASTAPTAYNVNAVTTKVNTYSNQVAEVCNMVVLDPADPTDSMGYLGGDNEVSPSYIAVTNNSLSGVRKVEVTAITVGKGDKETGFLTHVYNDKITADDINVGFKEVDSSEVGAKQTFSGPDLIGAVNIRTNSLSGSKMFAAAPFYKAMENVKAGDISATVTYTAVCS